MTLKLTLALVFEFHYECNTFDPQGTNLRAKQNALIHL